MIKRAVAAELLECAAQFPVVVVIGPRQSGKTTLVRAEFPHYEYVLLEDPDTREKVASDPRGFLQRLLARAQGVIIDEFQHLPELLSYLQGVVDADRRAGFFILTGSQHMLMMESISQTLVGRAAILELLPLSLAEVSSNGVLALCVEDVLYRGLFPRPFEYPEETQRWVRSYIALYLERDVRSLIAIKDLHLFQTFVRLCAGRVGNLLNVSSLATDCGISNQTAKNWLSTLEACFIIRLLQPYHRNFSKRLIKAPKLYFVDTALCAHLLGIEIPEQLVQHHAYGALFENMIIMELIKARTNAGKLNNVFFWRDTHGHEVDALLEYSDHVRAVEIKSTQTVTKSLFRGLGMWERIAVEHTAMKAFLVYGGEFDDIWVDTAITSWYRAGCINEL